MFIFCSYEHIAFKELKNKNMLWIVFYPQCIVTVPGGRSHSPAWSHAHLSHTHLSGSLSHTPVAHTCPGAEWLCFSASHLWLQLV